MELQIFNNTEFGSVRTININGEPMFVGTLDRFNDIVSSKRTLFQKALGTTSELITEREEDTLWFDWFDRMIDNKHLELYSTFIKALYRFAENAKRVNVSQKEVENEKFTTAYMSLRLHCHLKRQRRIMRILKT